jgi:hypothetical protein
MNKASRNALWTTAFLAFGVLLGLAAYLARTPKDDEGLANPTQSALVPSENANDSDVRDGKQSFGAEILKDQVLADPVISDPPAKNEIETDRAKLLQGAEQFRAKIKAEIKNSENQRLLDAGFSQQRIDELTRRKGELMSQLQQADFEAKQNGKPLNPSSLSGALGNV